MTITLMAPVNPFSGESKDPILTVMRRDRANFTRLVEDPANWNVMTRCTGWETRDLVGHLIDVLEGYFGVWDAARKGETPTPAGMAAMGGTLNDHALDFRRLGRDEALDRFNQDAMKLDGMLDGLSSDEWGSFMVSHPYAGPVPAGCYASFQIMDYGVHPYDIEYGLGNKLATIPEDSAGIILPFTFIFWQNTVDQKVAAGFATTYGIEVGGPYGGKWRCTVEDGKFAYEPESDGFAGCDALFSFETAAIEVLTHFGRFPGGSSQGDPEVIEKVRHLFFAF
jgi:uncharacterized protein (TIGR03083 family)